MTAEARSPGVSFKLAAVAAGPLVPPPIAVCARTGAALHIATTAAAIAACFAVRMALSREIRDSRSAEQGPCQPKKPSEFNGHPKKYGTQRGTAVTSLRHKKKPQEQGSCGYMHRLSSGEGGRER